MSGYMYYMGFCGTVKYSEDDECLYGQVLMPEHPGDTVTYEGQSVVEIIKSFHEAVDDYIELKKELK